MPQHADAPEPSGNAPIPSDPPHASSGPIPSEPPAAGDALLPEHHEHPEQVAADAGDDAAADADPVHSAEGSGGQPTQSNGEQAAEGEGSRRRRRRRGRDRDRTDEGGESNQAWEGELIEVAGILDLRDEGYGFLRVDGLLPSRDDVYVSVKQTRQFGLRRGDWLTGGADRPTAVRRTPRSCASTRSTAPIPNVPVSARCSRT